LVSFVFEYALERYLAVEGAVVAVIPYHHMAIAIIIAAAVELVN